MRQIFNAELVIFFLTQHGQTIQKKKIVKFLSFAFYTGTESTRICGVDKIECYKQAHLILFEEDIVEGLSDEEAKLFRQNCNCLPSCRSITYEVEVDRTKLNWKESINSFPPNVSSDEELDRYSVLFDACKIPEN